VNNNPLDLLVQFLAMFEEGRVLLPAGRYEYQITTKGRPALVWLAEVPSANVPTCNAGQNSFSTTLLDDGFVLRADVQTDYVELLWQANLEPSK
jgi:hypothetical protein